ncbi:uncharacterized protein LOC144326426 [Podarcis muralis]
MFQDYVAMVNNKFQRAPAVLMSDNGNKCAPCSLFDEHGKADTKNSVVDFSKESERTQELVYFPSTTSESQNLPSSVIAPPPTGDATEDAEDQTPGSTRYEEEDADGDMLVLEEDEEADAVTEPEVRRSSRTNRGVPPLRLSYFAGSAFPQEPSTWEEIQAMTAAEASLWWKAAQEEMDALHQNKTWTLTELPPKSEYVAATEACREVAWLDQLIKDFGLVRKEPVSLLEDNQSCLKLTQSEKFHVRTKHIGVKYHYIPKMIQEGLVELSYCSTEEMTADILTKPLPRDSFQNLRVKLGLCWY